jgi:hypothetical protein
MALMKKVLLPTLILLFVGSFVFATDTPEKNNSLFWGAAANSSGLEAGFGAEGKALGFEGCVSIPAFAMVVAQSPKGFLDPLVRLNGYWKLADTDGFNLNLGLSGFAFGQFEDATTAKICLFWGPGLDLVFRFKGGHSFFISGTVPVASVLSAIDDAIGGDSNLAKYAYAVIDLSGNGTDVSDVFALTFLGLVPSMARIGYRFYF